MSGLTVSEYTEALKKLNSQPTPKLMLVLAQLEKDFLAEWWERMQTATRLAKESGDYKALVAIEKEKQLTIDRLVKAGRMVSPFEQDKKEEESQTLDFGD